MRWEVRRGSMIGDQMCSGEVIMVMGVDIRKYTDIWIC